MAYCVLIGSMGSYSKPKEFHVFPRSQCTAWKMQPRRMDALGQAGPQPQGAEDGLEAQTSPRPVGLFTLEPGIVPTSSS